jgi:hypothetical protein
MLTSINNTAQCPEEGVNKPLLREAAAMGAMPAYLTCGHHHHIHRMQLDLLVEQHYAQRIPHHLAEYQRNLSWEREAT